MGDIESHATNRREDRLERAEIDGRAVVVLNCVRGSNHRNRIRGVEVDEIEEPRAIRRQVDLRITSGSLSIQETISTTANVSLTSSGTVSESGAGVINAVDLVVASVGVQTLTAANTIATFDASSTNAAITLNEVDGIAVGVVNAGTGTVTITLAAGAISDDNPPGTLNITGGNLVLTAPDGIDLDTSVTRLTATTTDSDITIREVTGIALNLIDAGTGDVIITAGGSITDNNGGANNVIATNLTLTAGTAIIGIETNVDTLVASAGNGSISITESDALQIIGLGLSTTGGNGSITVSAGGGFVINAAVSANGSGAVTLTSTGADTDIAVSGAVSSATGNVTLRATGDISLDDTIDTAGDVTLTADSESGGTGAITYTSGSVNADDLTVIAAEGITISTGTVLERVTGTSGAAVQLRSGQVNQPAARAGNAEKAVQDLFSKEMIASSVVKKFTYASSCVAINEGNGRFSVKELPVMSQLSCINAILPLDVNSDGYTDLVTGGNQFGFLGFY